MKRFVYRISFVLLLVIVIPIMFLIIKQFSNLTENEEIVQQAYEKQLESVLFSINLNTENIINSWINRIDLPVDYQDEVMQKMVERIFSENTSLQQVTFFSIQNRNILSNFNPTKGESINIQFPDSLKVKKLLQFQENGYQRIESQRLNEKLMLYFIPKSTLNKTICTIVIQPQSFFNQNLGSVIQQVAQNRFFISIGDNIQVSSIFKTDTLSTNNLKSYRQDFWYFPGYFMEISLLSKTIDDLVKERSSRDKYLLFALLGFVIVGSIFVIFNIRKEIKLAEIKSEFVSNVSHEIRTPLALISMYSETLLLKRLKNHEKTEEYLNVIHQETNRLSTMVNRILSFSKMEKNKRKYHFEFIEINNIIQDVVENFAPYFKAQNITCNIKLNANLDRVKVDKEALTEALINVIENAVKYSKDENKWIEIRTSQSSNYTIVDIEDNGIGIASKHHKHIFDKFYRVTQGDLALKTKGTGLGLNIVQQIMKKHGGKITVISKLGKGSCFRLQFSTNAN